MTRKSQIEITNIMFMHMIGLMGILAFTFLFLSLVTSSSARAEALNQETLYYGYGRRLISASDCFAYNQIESYYDGTTFSSFERTMPGVIDVSKLYDYSHQNCLRYDLVSGGVWGYPDAPQASFPVLIYEVTVRDLVTDKDYDFKNDVYSVVAEGTSNSYRPICDPDFCTQAGCLYDCNQLREYIEDPDAYEAKYGPLPNSDTSLDCAYDLEGNKKPPSTVETGTNCWTQDLNDVARLVEPYNGDVDFNCDIKGSMIGTEFETGKVFETNLQYAVTLRYPTGLDDFLEHPGVFNVRFCVIKIPTYCDPFFEHATVGFFDTGIFQRDYCKSVGLPLA
jgi:hypothetical protein